jgi:hypothetical protein
MVNIASIQYLLELIDDSGKIAPLPFHPEADDVNPPQPAKQYPDFRHRAVMLSRRAIVAICRIIPS